MSMIEQFLWVIVPYACIVIFIVGHIFRYRTDQFSWTAKSSEFIEKKQLMIGSMLFHIGIVPVILGHVVGLGFPKEWMTALGVSEHMYHLGAVYGGGLFGFITFAGMLILTTRRFTIRSVRRLSSASDLVVNTLLLFIVFMGMYATIFTNFSHPEFDYRETISIWFRGLFILQPNAHLMHDVPISFKIHAMTGFVILAFWPFSRLVHVWSVPLNYVGRSYILYRRHKSN